MSRSNVQRIDRGQVHFGFDLDPVVDGHLQQAAARVSDRDASLQALNAARQSAPEQLEVLQALYKFHFYRGDLQQAQDLVYQSLIKASMQGGFSRDWQTLDAHSADWQAERGPARSFLYSLKALAFIRLRQDDSAEAARVLDTLRRLDPQDRVGADVIRDLLDGLEE
jgi:multidrug resistance efflux pump